MFGFRTKRLIIEEQRQKIAQLQEELFRARPKIAQEIKPSVNEHFVKQLAQLSETVLLHGNGFSNHGKHLVELSERLDLINTACEKRMEMVRTALDANRNRGSDIIARLERLEKLAAYPTPSHETNARLAALEAKTDGHGNALEMAAIDHEVLVKLTDMLDIDVVPRNADEAVDLVPRTKKGSK